MNVGATQSSSSAPLVNISTRGEIGTADGVLIGGFIIGGTGSKTVLLRAIGPSLGDAGVANPLADPTLELHDAAGATIASNNDWQTTVIGGLITTNQLAGIRDRDSRRAAPRNPPS